MKEIDLAYRTLFAELGQRSLDGTFAADFPLEGRFVTVPVKGKEYWYFDMPTGGGDKRSYVGPKSDAEITGRVSAFGHVKNDLKSRRKLVSTLVREAGMSAPERFTGDVVEALANAGLFRLRSVLVGTVAFQTYSGLLGVRLPSSAMQTGDADFAQFHSISAAVGDSIPPILDVLQKLDDTFRQVPHINHSQKATQFINAGRYKVEFLTPNTGSDDNQDKPVDMPAPGGASAEPLRFLDYLIYEPVRTVMLWKSGISVNVPAPERYATHKLIVASRRRNDDNGILKRDKDVRQAALLFEALGQTRRHSDLAVAFSEAWNRGQAWQDGIRKGVSFLAAKHRTDLMSVLREGMQEIGENPDDYTLFKLRTPDHQPGTVDASNGNHNDPSLK
ncbi:nucleotidyltransferase family protein [Rhizobium herbae]|uniref:Nucleotidyltransferase-like domain-containing protein n=1 Tax=Rhizobium herbae TaxID=508661 RepID=A0ABS4EP07_9HYPH|nr:GSU2403 family nucleotidyltransferase fold protein [Rhizobium herbae]MBP1859682.1 hypothetical protein [Rhizobium herbae]